VWSLQPAAEAHIVSAVGLHQAPTDWGCDSLWRGGAVVYDRCVSVFAVGYTLDEGAESPAFMRDLLDSAPHVAGEETPFPAADLDLSWILPVDKTYYTYAGSLVRCRHPMVGPT
jgi:Eukaryotic-type carbonic anhydrase